MGHVNFPPHVIANNEIEEIGNLVPGAEMLGYGFNIFGVYAFSSAIRPLLELGNPGSWKAPSGTTYDVPANVATPGGSSSTASAAVFASSSAFSNYFQSSASVSGSIGAFSATFQSTYDTSQQNSSQYSWALLEADFNAWQVGINYTPNILRNDVKTDTDWSNLPSHFDAGDPANVLAFYRFFQKFGTHFISTVTAGGTLYYYYSVAQSASLSAEQISVSATAEYQGLISSGKAEADAHWGQCASNWTSSRQSHSFTVPATTGVLRWVNPQAGAFDQDNDFGDWKNAVVNNPSRCKFSLTPIWNLFSGGQWLAIEQAYNAYASNRVTVHATLTGMSTILVNGMPIIPTTGYPSLATGGWQIAILDRKTLGVTLNKAYTFNYGASNWPDDTYGVMVTDLQPYVGNQDYILIAATFNIDEASSPNAAFYAMLKSFGAGAGADLWNAQPNHGCSSGTGSAVYSLVGSGASAAGLEGFGDTHVSGSPTTVAVNALLLPSGGSFTPMSYQP